MRRLIIACLSLCVAACAPLDGGYAGGPYGDGGWDGGWGGGLFGDGYDDADVVVERARRTCVSRAEEQIGDVRRVGRVERTGRYRADVPLRVRRPGGDDTIVCRYDDGDVRFAGLDRPDDGEGRPGRDPEPRPPAVDPDRDLARRAEARCERAALGRGLRVESSRFRGGGEVQLDVREGSQRYRVGCRFDPRSDTARLDRRTLGAGGAAAGEGRADEARAVRACRSEARGEGFRQLETLAARSEGSSRYGVRLRGTRDGRVREIRCAYDARSGRTALRG